MNIPNSLSLFRLALVPVFVWLFFKGGDNGQLYATGVFLLAGATDMLDGYLARRLGQITMLGRILDPLADKLMVLSALVCCMLSGYIPTWAVVLFVVKESAQGLLGLLLFRRVKDVPPSNVIGKTGTVLFYITIAAGIVFTLPAALSYLMLTVSFGCIFAALISYVVGGLRISKEN